MQGSRLGAEGSAHTLGKLMSEPEREQTRLPGATGSHSLGHMLTWPSQPLQERSGFTISFAHKETEAQKSDGHRAIETTADAELEGRRRLLLGAAFRSVYLKEGVVRRASGVSWTAKDGRRLAACGLPPACSSPAECHPRPARLACLSLSRPPLPRELRQT